MCDIAKYPDLYNKTDWVLRLMKMNREMPGYELLRRAIVVWEVEGKKFETEVNKEIEEGRVQPEEHDILIERKIIQKVAEIAPMQFSKRLVVNDKNTFEQAMIESIRSVSSYGVKLTILEFLTDVTEHIF